MIEQENLFGAIIFWLYIVLALLFTFLAIESIVRLPNAAPHKHVATFTVLALLSFSTLSFNMLHVLFDSYSTWSERQLSPLPLSPSSIWKWSVTSTLFRNFGKAIARNDARFLWTQSALLATMSVSFFMGARGLCHRIPRLWAFFALLQILPISFAQNIFYVALLRSPDPKRHTVVLARTSVLVVMAAYCACLLVAPYTADGPYLMPTILTARLLLFVPSFLPAATRHSEDHATAVENRFFSHRHPQKAVAAFAVGMTVKQVIFVVQGGYSLGGALSALLSHPAVTSLGFDFIVTVLSFTIWVSVTDNQTTLLKKTN